MQDITGSVKRSGEHVADAILTQTRQLVGSLESGFGRMEYGMEQVAAGVEGLRAEFSYGMGLIASQLQIQGRTYTDLSLEFPIKGRMEGWKSGRWSTHPSILPFRVQNGKKQA